MNELALLGGEPLIKKPLQPYISLGDEEINAVDEVLKKENLEYYVKGKTKKKANEPVARGKSKRLLEKEVKNIEDNK